MQTSTPSHKHKYHWYNYWSKRSHPINFTTPPSSGHQIFHADIDDQPIWNDPESVEYAKKHMADAKKFACDAHTLKYAVELAQQSKGLFLEFGVWGGMSTNFIAALSPYHTLHAFDSFQGLPGDWVLECPKNTFGLHPDAELPALLPNTELHIGLFENTLPIFRDTVLKDHPIAFIHIDCNMYCSVKSVFNQLKPNIGPGTVIQFDEYFNVKKWKENEYRAFQEFILSTDLEYEYVAYNDCHMQVVVQIK